MRAALLAVAVGLSLLPATSTAPEGDNPTPPAQGTPLVDGPSMDAQVNGIRVPIGYLGVDTPPANQPCGLMALQRNQELAGDHVLLMSDPLFEFDASGRRLYYAFTIDGVSIDEVLIREDLGRAVR